MPNGKRIVVPGELLSERAERVFENAYVHDGKVYSQVLGVYSPHPSGVKVTPLSGVYAPKPGDLVLGLVEDVKFAGLVVDVSSSISAFLPSSELPRGVAFKTGELIAARVMEVDELGAANLSSAAKLAGGELVEVSSAKVPRIIGAKQSMLDLLKLKTKCKILVGLNGRVWIDGENSALAASAVLKIAREAHLDGLTDRMTAFLNGQAPQ